MSKPRMYTAPALEKGLDILELVAREAAPLSMTQISERLGRSKGEIFRMILVLEARGYIARRPDTDGYFITNRLFLLAMEQPLAQGLIEAAWPVMRRLTEETWQSCHLVVASLDEIVVIARAESPGDVSYSVRLGHRRPIAHSASGAVLFAFQPPPIQAQWLERLKRSSDFDEAEFVREAEAARRSRLIRRKSERVRGVIDLATPIVHADTAVATLVIPHLEQNPVRMDIKDVMERLRAAGEEISQTLTRGGGGGGGASRSKTR